MEQIRYEWTDGSNKVFQRFYLKTEEFYSNLVGGEKNRKGFIPYNISQSISTVVIAYIGNTAVGCAGLKAYSDTDAEINRVWVDPEFRGLHIAQEMMDRIEERASELGFKRTILWTISS